MSVVLIDGHAQVYCVGLQAERKIFKRFVKCSDVCIHACMCMYALVQDVLRPSMGHVKQRLTLVAPKRKRLENIHAKKTRRCSSKREGGNQDIFKRKRSAREERHEGLCSRDRCGLCLRSAKEEAEIDVGSAKKRDKRPCRTDEILARLKKIAKIFDTYVYMRACMRVCLHSNSRLSSCCEQYVHVCMCTYVCVRAFACACAYKCTCSCACACSLRNSRKGVEQEHCQ